MLSFHYKKKSSYPTSPIKKNQHSLIALLRQSIYSRLAGYEGTNNAARLRVDPSVRRIVGERAKDLLAASTSEMNRFETEMLAPDDNLENLSDVCSRWVDQVAERLPRKQLVLDMDSSESPTHGQQEGSAYNGHLVRTCYHPLFCFNQDGGVERTSLRRGNVHSTDDWRSVLEPVVRRYRDKSLERFFRGDDSHGLGVHTLRSVKRRLPKTIWGESLRHAEKRQSLAKQWILSDLKRDCRWGSRDDLMFRNLNFIFQTLSE